MLTGGLPMCARSYTHKCVHMNATHTPHTVSTAQLPRKGGQACGRSGPAGSQSSLDSTRPHTPSYFFPVASELARRVCRRWICKEAEQESEPQQRGSFPRVTARLPILASCRERTLRRGYAVTTPLGHCTRAHAQLQVSGIRILPVHMLQGAHTSS